MCDECEEAVAAPVFVRKVNRYGWRPPVAAATAPHADDRPVDRIAAPAFACVELQASETAKADPCA
jgi:hypothetical protein